MKWEKWPHKGQASKDQDAGCFNLVWISGLQRVTYTLKLKPEEVHMCCMLGIHTATPLEPGIKRVNWSRRSVISTQSSAPVEPATHSSCGFMPPLLKIAKYGQRVFALVSSSLDEWWQVIVGVPHGQTRSKAPNCCCPLQLQLNLASCCNNQCGVRSRPPCALF